MVIWEGEVGSDHVVCRGIRLYGIGPKEHFCSSAIFEGKDGDVPSKTLACRQQSLTNIHVHVAPGQR